MTIEIITGPGRFDSMINLRPSQENRSRGVDNPDMRNKIRRIVEKLVVD